MVSDYFFREGIHSRLRTLQDIARIYPAKKTTGENRSTLFVLLLDVSRHRRNRPYDHAPIIREPHPKDGVRDEIHRENKIPQRPEDHTLRPRRSLAITHAEKQRKGTAE